MMLERKSIPNLLTGARLALVPLLWGVAFAGHASVVGAGMVVAWITDALDGFLARRWNAQSAWGSRFDSVADLLMFVSGFAWIVLLRPEFVQRYAVLLGAWLAVGSLAYAVGWIRFRRVADVHLYSAKAANFLGFWLAAWVLGLGMPPAAITVIVLGVCLLAAVETLAAIAILDRIDGTMTTILRRPRSSRPLERHDGDDRSAATTPVTGRNAHPEGPGPAH